MIFAWIRSWLQRRRRFREALAFNTRNTFRWSQPGRWQCPSCGKVHAERSLAKFSGPQFDACCEFPAGGRMGRRFASPL